MMREERLHQVLCELRADDARTEHEHVHIVVLHALMRGIGIVAHRRPDPRQLICRHARPDPAAADEHAALGLAVQHCPAHGFGKVWIVGWVFIERADIQHIVSQRAQ